ncbi:MAG: hypothetical protein ACJ768_02810 [Gaiellaceae bacterium]
MGIFGRRRKQIDGNDGQPGLAGDALRMRAALAAMVAERRRLGEGAEGDLRALVEDLLTGEVASPTSDVARLVEHHVDPGAFYEKEIAPSWEGLGEVQRAARLDGFLDLSRMLDEQGDAAGLPEEMAATVHTKTLLLAFAFDETYGYLSRIASGV